MVLMKIARVGFALILTLSLFSLAHAQDAETAADVGVSGAMEQKTGLRIDIHTDHQASSPQNPRGSMGGVAETLVCATISEGPDPRAFPVATMCCATRLIRNRFRQSSRTEESMIPAVRQSRRLRAGFVDTRLTSVFCSIDPGTPST